MISRHIRSNVIGYMALFVALSGTAYAVDGPLPGQNQVGSADIINDDVRSVDIRDDTQAAGGLAAADLGPDSVGTSEVAPDSLDAVDLNAGCESEPARSSMMGSSRPTSTQAPSDRPRSPRERSEAARSTLTAS